MSLIQGVLDGKGRIEEDDGPGVDGLASRLAGSSIGSSASSGSGSSSSYNGNAGRAAGR
jgi:serine/threonine-protein phosphatase 2B catalytic subunit